MPTWWDVRSTAWNQLKSAPWQRCGYPGRVVMNLAWDRNGYLSHSELSFQHATPELKAISPETRACIEKAFWSIRVAPFRPGEDSHGGTMRGPFGFAVQLP